MIILPDIRYTLSTKEHKSLLKLYRGTKPTDLVINKLEFDIHYNAEYGKLDQLNVNATVIKHNNLSELYDELKYLFNIVIDNMYLSNYYKKRTLFESEKIEYLMEVKSNNRLVAHSYETIIFDESIRLNCVDISKIELGAVLCFRHKF